MAMGGEHSCPLKLYVAMLTTLILRAQALWPYITAIQGVYFNNNDKANGILIYYMDFTALKHNLLNINL